MTLDTTHSAAHHLVGIELPGGWKVMKQVPRKPGATGGHFSVGYIVQNKEQTAFLKALSILAVIKSGRSLIDALSEVSLSHKYERDLMALCRNKQLTKVSLLLSEGEVVIPGYMFDTVPYLIFERADDDVRGFLEFSDKVEIAWKLKSLHNVAVGLSQLHKIDVAHQDLKPSNVFVFNRNTCKVGDLGRSLCKEIIAPHANLDFAGDLDYSPPEIWYGYIIPDWNRRVFSVDLYLFGSLIAFYFTGLNMSALILKNLDPQFHFSRWPHSFNEVSPYLMNAFDKSLTELSTNISNAELSKNIRDIVTGLCCPIPEKRGDNKTILNEKFPHDLQRTISRLDILFRRAEMNLLK